jgi:hypothetical protein
MAILVSSYIVVLKCFRMTGLLQGCGAALLFLLDGIYSHLTSQQAKTMPEAPSCAYLKRLARSCYHQIQISSDYVVKW